LWEKVGESGAPEGIRRLVVKTQEEQMFLGQYQHNIDSKGRLTVPARFRELLEEGAYVTQGFDRSLMVMTTNAFELISQRVRTMSITNPEARLLRRLIFSNGEHVEIDKAGRILIPQFLRQAAGLDGEAVVVGLGDYFEIWSPEEWDGQSTQLQDAEANAHRFAALDISSI
jgi:MraZ protein